MKRKFAVSLLLVLLLSLLLPVSALASSSGNLSYVTDSAGILSESQRQELESMAAGISEKYQCGVYIVTTQDYTEGFRPGRARELRQLRLFLPKPRSAGRRLCAVFPQ